MIAITIDCEQWNSGELRNKKDNENNNTNYSREGNKRLLKILEKHNIPVTFFVTGFFAEKEKKQIKEISKKHEIACHGYSHFYRDNILNLKQDIEKSKKILEKITNKKICGFRAPQMQFSKELINILERLNFKYDSSIHAAYLPGFYNNKNINLKPFKINKITEIPASASYFFRIPVNWIFMRNMPLSYTIRIVKRLLKNRVVPVLYFHSWEFFEVKNKSVPFYITRNTGKKFCKKFDKFLDYFKNEKFVLLKDLI